MGFLCFSAANLNHDSQALSNQMANSLGIDLFFPKFAHMWKV